MTIPVKVVEQQVIVRPTVNVDRAELLATVDTRAIDAIAPDIAMFNDAELSEFLKAVSVGLDALEGGNNSGSQFFNGTTTVGATGVDGGFFIPSGSSGFALYTVQKWPFADGVAATNAGKTMQLVVIYQSVTGDIDELFDVNDDFDAILQYGSALGTAGTFSNAAVTKLTSTRFRLFVEYEPTGNETEVRYGFQRSGQSLMSADLSFYPVEKYYVQAETRTLEAAVDQKISVAAEVRTQSLPDLRPITEWRGNHVGGAVSLDDFEGLTIPSGSIGTGTNDQRLVPYLTLARYVGAVIRTELDYTHTEGALTETVMGITGEEPGPNGLPSDTPSDFISTAVTSLSATSMRFSATDNIEPEDRSMAIYPFVATESVERTSDATFTLTAIRHVIVSLPDGVLVNDVIAEFRQAYHTEVLLRGRPDVSVSVIAHGGGDYDNIVTAFRAVGGGHDPAAYNELVLEGHFLNQTDATKDVWLPDYTVMRGKAHPHETVVEVDYPDGTADQDDIEVTYTINTVGSAGLRRIANQARYGDHEETGNRSVGPRQFSHYEIIENKGSDGWASWSAIGAGDCDGKHISRVLNFLTQPYGYHSNINWRYGMTREIEAFYIFCPDQSGFRFIDGEKTPSPMGGAIDAIDQGSGVASHVKINGLSTNAPWLVNKAAAALLGVKLWTQTGYGYGYVHRSSDMVDAPAVIGLNGYQVLELRAQPTANSSVGIGGTGGFLAMGYVPNIWPGGTNYAGRAFSAHRVTTDAPVDPGVTMAARFGDLTGSAPTFQAVLNGVSTNFVMDADFSAMTNEQARDWLNTALATALGRALVGDEGFHLTTPYNYRSPDFFPNAERLLMNRDTVVVQLGDAVALDEAGEMGLGGRLMTNADPAWVYRGLSLGEKHPALGNSPPLAAIRTRLTGYVPGAMLNFDTASIPGADKTIADVAFGETLSVGTTPGQFVVSSVTGAGPALLRRVANSPYGPLFELAG